MSIQVVKCSIKSLGSAFRSAQIPTGSTESFLISCENLYSNICSEYMRVEIFFYKKSIFKPKKNFPQKKIMQVLHALKIYRTQK